MLTCGLLAADRKYDDPLSEGLFAGVVTAAKDAMLQDVYTSFEALARRSYAAPSKGETGRARLTCSGAHERAALCA